ncbi:MAG: TonB-dependent receptor [Candidatus Zixiibacteriota bacterium]
MPSSTRIALLTAVLCVLSATQTSWSATLNGRVTDAETGQPVIAASVSIAGTSIGTITNDDGRFELADLPDGSTTLIVHHVAYRPWRRTVDGTTSTVMVLLTPVVLPGQDIVVTTSRAKRGESPVAFDNLTGSELRQGYHAQDIPMLLTEAPGVYAFSDNGNGVGYSYLSIRGFSQRRVSVLINGVPLNDPESHEVYWIDLPDLASSVEDAQIQRGVGTTLYGSNSIGGTINIRTLDDSPVRELTAVSGMGSYNTRKFTLLGNSGVIDGRYALSGRFSRIVSDGYRDNAWTDLWSYYFAATRFDEKWTNRLILLGGPEQTHLAYKGIPRRFIEGDTSFSFNGVSPSGDPDTDRRYNPFEWDNETDNFNQPQYQFHTEYRPSSRVLIENTVFYIKGDGYYDQLRTGEDFGEYHLRPFTQIVVEDGTVDTIDVDAADRLWRRRWVANDFWGIVPRVTTRHDKGTFTFGAEFRHHRGDHWGEVQSATPVDSSFVPGQHYYDYKGRKIVASAYAQEVYTPISSITLTGAMQLAFKEYRLFDNRFPNIYGQTPTHTTRYYFLSPRAGVTVRPGRSLTLFGSVSYNEQEPTNDEIFDPQDYYANANDFFADYDEVTGIGSDPLMKPERLIDFELGASVDQPRWRAEINLFHMRFHDEIVWNGLLNDDGVPIRANAPSTVHQGIELSADLNLGQGVSVRGNLAINDNTFDEFIEYVPDWDNWGDVLPVDTVDRSGNSITGSPKHLANLRLNYDREEFGLSAHVFSAGRQFIDNSNSDDVSIDPYAVVNLRGDVNVGHWLQGADLTLFVLVNNIFNTKYETGGYVDEYPLFLPAASRNVFVGIKASL